MSNGTVGIPIHQIKDLMKPAKKPNVLLVGGLPGHHACPPVEMSEIYDVDWRAGDSPNPVPSDLSKYEFAVVMTTCCRGSAIAELEKLAKECRIKVVRSDMGWVRMSQAIEKCGIKVPQPPPPKESWKEEKPQRKEESVAIKTPKKPKPIRIPKGSNNHELSLAWRSIAIAFFNENPERLRDGKMTVATARELQQLILDGINVELHENTIVRNWNETKGKKMLKEFEVGTNGSQPTSRKKPVVQAEGITPGGVGLSLEKIATANKVVAKAFEFLDVLTTLDTVLDQSTTKPGGESYWRTKLARTEEELATVKARNEELEAAVQMTAELARK